MIALVLATVLGALFALARRRGLIAAATVALALVLTVASLVSQTVDIYGWVTRVEQSDALSATRSAGRPRAAAAASRWRRRASTLWLHGDTVLGYGPSNTESTLRASGAAYVKEAHDDYLATLLERGVIGGLALILLIVAVGVRARRISATGGLEPGAS